MGEWLKKNGVNILLGGMVTGWFAVAGGAIASMIKHEKREKTYYQKMTEIQDEELTFLREQNKKEA